MPKEKKQDVRDNNKLTRALKTIEELAVVAVTIYNAARPAVKELVALWRRSK